MLFGGIFKDFSGGVSGEPKAVPWTQHTPLRCALDGWAHLDLKFGDVLCWPTNLGWMVGPMILAASFMNGAALALYNGSPLGRGFGKFVQASQFKYAPLCPFCLKTTSNHSKAPFTSEILRSLSERTLSYWH